LRGTFAVATSRAPGVTVTIRDRFDATADEELWADFAADGRLDSATDPRPSAAGEAIGVAIAATVDLAPGERRSVRFALAWDLPVVEFGAGRRWYKRYTRDWGRTGERAFDLASHALEQAPAWRAAIEAWQGPVLASDDRPDWYKAALFNELYFLVDQTANVPPPLAQAPPTMNVVLRTTLPPGSMIVLPAFLMTLASPRFRPMAGSRKSTSRVSMQVKMANCFFGFFGSGGNAPG
jgi:hypothetical protein